MSVELIGFPDVLSEHEAIHIIGGFIADNGFPDDDSRLATAAMSMGIQVGLSMALNHPELAAMVESRLPLRDFVSDQIRRLLKQFRFEATEDE